jgi:serine/threonine protein kinase
MNKEPSVNTNLSHYRIVSKIGAGGMGEVYLAEDSRLGRRVAIKILPPLFTADADRLQRFQQEARAASALNHPNILTIHEIGETADQGFYIATEFIDGETLREKLQRERLTVEEALDVALQTASALSAAHEAGIIHRDIKPENIMIRRDGIVKVLDFGLAKLTEENKSAIDTEAETRAQVKTAPGVIMGTVQYMSPEQARGKVTDARTDIWSLGCVLYEMITARAAFSGETVADLIADIVKSNPAPLSEFSDEVPERLEEIVSKTLEKNTDERYQTAKDLLIDLRRLKRKLDFESEMERSHAPAKRSSEAALKTSDERKTLIVATDTTQSAELNKQTVSSAEYIATEIKRHKTGAIIASVILLFVIPFLGYSLYRFIQISSKQPEQTANQIAPSNLKIQRLTGNGKVSRAAISPDGKFLAYVQNEGGQQSLWTKQISTNSNVQTVAPGVMEQFDNLTFTPDGSFIYFAGKNMENRSNTIFRVPTLGGSLSKIISNARSVSFSPDGKQIVFGRWDAKTAESVLIIANADGTNERKLTSLFDNFYFSGALGWSPDGKLIASGVGDDKKLERKQTVAVIEVSSGALKELSEYKWDSIDSLTWLPDMSGMIFSADDTGGGDGVSKLFEISYPSGESRRMTQNLTDYSRVSLTADGKTLISVESDFTSSIWVSPNADLSRATQITTGKANYARGIAWTPDKRIVYIANTSGIEEVWIINADGSNQKQLTNDGRLKYTPVVSPDGCYIVYATSQGGNDLWRINIDGSNQTLLTGKPADEANPDISPDGKWIVYSAWTFGKQAIWRMPIEGGEAQRLTDFESKEPHVSPDGRFIACFFADEKNVTHLGIIPSDGGALIKTFDVPTTVETDMSPKWTPDGRGITLIDERAGIGNLWVQPVDGGAPKQLTDFKQNGIHRREWTRDGKQVAIVRGEGNSDAIMITDFR